MTDGEAAPGGHVDGGGRRTLHVGMLARVEGEGALHIEISGGRVTGVQLRIFEPPRFFEALLRGRNWTEPPDITSRICGICPVAYQVSACQAIEDACGVVLPEPLRRLRRLLYCGEWIESHALHIYLLHAPDFLGYDGAVEMARDHRDLVQRGLRLKKAGNEVLAVLGGRSVHPVNMRLGGFHRLPTPAELRGLRETLAAALGDALATVETVARLEFPEVEHDCVYASLRPAQGYPIESGRVVTSDGDSFDVADFDAHVSEEQAPYSTALRARLNGVAGYLVGPLARYSLNSAALSPLAREAAAAAGLGLLCRNPFKSIIVRAVEVVYACEEGLRIIGEWDGAPAAAVPAPPRAGVGRGASEAPRGLLYHRYRLAGDGAVADASIVPPTSQNQLRIEEDLRELVQTRLELPTGELTRLCEMAIRNYDPCISCSAHFLTLEISRC